VESVVHFNKMHKLFYALLIFTLLPSSKVLTAQQHHHHGAEGGDSNSVLEKLGAVHMPISCAHSRQAPFERGIALLHSFWFRFRDHSKPGLPMRQMTLSTLQYPTETAARRALQAQLLGINGNESYIAQRSPTFGNVLDKFIADERLKEIKVDNLDVVNSN
jgi:hypothetical protein